ncbi:restriction endonuclease subunit S [Microbulbifer sediminum]|uniref:restriction endonuclease subunit S n=1 Tax=Microbulbifer sediminum TaxID=2904250 RepID=UPI001F022868|nr:restriction endonuclease subunit S [Microbulbifer sediminum]
MGSEWKTVRFGELYAEPSRNGLTKPKKVRGEGYKFINMGEIFAHGRMLNIECDRVPATKKELQTSTMEPGDLLFARQSLVLSGAGKCSIFLGDDEITVFESHLIRVRPDRKQVLSEYLYYYFNSPIGRSEIWNITEQGAGQAGIRGSDLQTVQVKLPSISEQSKIVAILSAIDKKIELNRQINTTLESMAQALFKSWFVDFYPVIDNALAAGDPIPDALQARARARQELRTAAGASAQKLPAELQQLFPSSFEFNEQLGWIPEGWEISSIYSLTEVVYGAPFSSKLFNDEALGKPIIRIRDLKTGKPQIWSSEEHPKGTLIKAGDVIVGMDAEFRATLWSGQDGWLNQRLFLARCVNGYSNSFLIQQVLKPLLAREESSQVGTTVAHLGKKDIDKFRWLTPSKALIKEYSARTNELVSQWINAHEQTRTLVELRDYLLPKLLSGQLQVPEAEQQLAEVI